MWLPSHGMPFPEVNISNLNAAYLAGVLGFKWDGDCVLFAADDLLGRVTDGDGSEPVRRRCACTQRAGAGRCDDG